MKTLLVAISIFCLFFTLNAQINVEPGVVLIKLKNPDSTSIQGTSVINGGQSLQFTFQQYQMINSHMLPYAGPNMKGWYLLEFPINAPLDELKAALKCCPEIRYVALSVGGILCGNPNDPLWSYQWALQKARVHEAWDYTLPETDIIVGVLDTGLDYRHEDLIDNIWQNTGDGGITSWGEDADHDGHTLQYISGSWQFDPGDINGIDNDQNGYADDLIGWNFYNNTKDIQDVGAHHGTRVAGVIAAKTYNATGLAGIAGGWSGQPGVRIVGLRITDPTLSQWRPSRAALALTYLIHLRNQGKIVIANMSFQTTGIGDEDPEDLQPLTDAIADANSAGVILVAAAGNLIDDPKSPYDHVPVDHLPYPANYNGVLAIGASTYGTTLQNEIRSWYSLYTEFSEFSEQVFCVAPVDKQQGVLDIVTTAWPINQYTYTFDGTSASCPIAVGTIALLLSANPNLTATNIKNILAETCDKIGTYTYSYNGYTEQVGYGRINTYYAAAPPVAPLNLTAYANPGPGYQYFYARLNWHANTEPDLTGYEVFRKIMQGSTVFENWHCIAFTTNSTYQDMNMPFLPWGDYDLYYKVRAKDLAELLSNFSNEAVIYGVEIIPHKDNSLISTTILPINMELYANYPNPFNPSTNIVFGLPKDDWVEINIYSVTGQRIITLVNEQLEKGYHTVVWNGRDGNGNSVASGLYIYELLADGKRLVNKMFLMK